MNSESGKPSGRSRAPRADDSYATRRSLLERLQHWSDQESWQVFFNQYWKLIYSVARKAGLTDAEAQDIVQETVLAVAQNIEGFVYDPAVCSFKNWMLRLTRWRILDQLKKRSRESPPDPTGPEAGRPVWESIPDPDSLELNAIWEREWQHSLYEAAIEQVKETISPAQFQLFDLCVTEEWPPAEVARKMGVSAARVYVAKHRVSRLIRKAVAKLQRGDPFTP